MKQTVFHPPLKHHVKDVVKVNSNEATCFMEQNAENHIKSKK